MDPIKTNVRDGLLPLGQKPEGELHSFKKVTDAFHKLLSTVNKLEDNLSELQKKNDALEKTVKELSNTPFKLTPDPKYFTTTTEANDGHK